MGSRVTQDGELAIYDAVPDLECMLPIIHADRYKTRVEGSKFFGVPRELAQFACAVGSPVPTVEDQEHPLAAQRREVKSPVALVPEGKIRSRLTFCRNDLGPGQYLLCRDNPGQQQDGSDLNQNSPGHGPGFYSILEVARPANPVEVH